MNMKKTAIFLCLALVLTIGVSGCKKVEAPIDITEDKVAESSKKLINTLNQLEKDLKKYLEDNHSQEENDAFYAKYLDKLDSYSRRIDVGTLTPLGYEFPKLYEEGKIPSAENPLPSSVVFYYLSEGTYCIASDFYYQIDNYGKYLSPAMNEYLAIELSQNYLHDYYLKEGHIRNMSELRLWIQDWESFKKRHPDFIRNKDVQEAIDLYTGDFLWHYDMSDGNDKLNNAAKAEYELFLATADKNTGSYKTVKKFYEILKSHDFKFSEEFEKEYVKAFPNAYQSIGIKFRS